MLLPYAPPGAPGPVAVVTGANRGLGLALAEQLAQSGSHVVLTARDQQRGATAAAALADRGLSVESAPLDVQCGASIAVFGDYCERALGGRIDLLINNAAVCEEGWSAEVVGRTLRTNVLGPRALTARLQPCLARAAAAAGSGPESELLRHILFVSEARLYLYLYLYLYVYLYV